MRSLLLTRSKDLGGGTASWLPMVDAESLRLADAAAPARTVF